MINDDKDRNDKDSNNITTTTGKESTADTMSNIVKH